MRCWSFTFLELGMKHGFSQGIINLSKCDYGVYIGLILLRSSNLYMYSPIYPMSIMRITMQKLSHSKGIRNTIWNKHKLKYRPWLARLWLLSCWKVEFPNRSSWNLLNFLMVETFRTLACRPSHTIDSRQVTHAISVHECWSKSRLDIG